MAQTPISILIEALTEIASYKEGPVVTGSFDEPVAAIRARKALKDYGNA